MQSIPVEQWGDHSGLVFIKKYKHGKAYILIAMYGIDEVTQEK